MKRAFVAVVLARARAAAGALAKGEFDPRRSSSSIAWVPIHIGPLDLSITKTVAYLLLGAIVTIDARRLADALARRSARQALRRADLRDRADAGRGAGAARRRRSHRWFPYVATLMLFIFVINLLGFIPLPLSDEKWHGGGPDARDLCGDVVTLGDARARAPDVLLHSLRRHPLERPGPVLQELDPGGAEGDAAADHPAGGARPVHAADLAVRPTLREHARGAHAHPDVHRADLRARERSCSRSIAVPAATAFYLFEVVIVVGIQAFIFAALSAIYIGSAIEPDTRRYARVGLISLRPRRTESTPARRLHWRSVSASARSVPVSASATSSAR